MTLLRLSHLTYQRLSLTSGRSLPPGPGHIGEPCGPTAVTESLCARLALGPAGTSAMGGGMPAVHPQPAALPAP